MTLTILTDLCRPRKDAEFRISAFSEKREQKFEGQVVCGCNLAKLWGPPKSPDRLLHWDWSVLGAGRTEVADNSFLFLARVRDGWDRDIRVARQRDEAAPNDITKIDCINNPNYVFREVYNIYALNHHR